jgi:UDP-N-acetylglucosamine--N-acetylmuramyl-(pentapeptide) pyrophosphoryl-undecaprenol N-acetylglucosamine transferase
MRVVVSGGGTAGHITPTLATSDALKSLDSTVDILYVGQADGLEARIVAARGLEFAAIKAGKFRRNQQAGTVAKLANLHTIGPNTVDAFRTISGVAASLKILRQFKPDVVFLKGGFVCVPVGIAARILKIPFVIHDSDVTPGLTTRLLARWATKIAVGFPVRHYHDLDPAKLVFTGSPVRSEIASVHRLDGLAKFELDDKLPVLFVTGGSGGARQINDVVGEALPQLLDFCQVIHLTGEGEYERVKFEQKRRPALDHPERYHVFGFLLEGMPYAFAAADIVISRAGANSIAELALLKKPTVLIPNYQMAGHQIENARVLSRAGAARVLDGAKLTADRLVGEVRHMLDDPAEQERLSKAIAHFSNPEAPKALAQLIMATAKVGSRGELKPNTGDEA